MKILHISGAISWGGNEQQLIYLIVELNKIGIKNCVFCIENSALHEFIKPLGFTYYTVPKKNKFSLSNVKKLSTVVNDEGVDLIHAHKSNSIITYWLSNIFYKNTIPLIYSQKGISSSTTLFSKLKYNYKGIKKIICVSKYVSENFKGMMYKKNYNKLVVVHDSVASDELEKVQAIDLYEKYGLSTDFFLFGHVANHSIRKDLITFVKTVNYLVNELNIKKVHFFQVGKKTKYGVEALKLVEELQLQEYITFVGFVKNGTSFIKSFDIFLITSEREGGPSSALEAMCLRTPIISTSTGIMPEIIKNNENGLLCEIKDFKSLAENIEKVIDKEKMRIEFAERSYRLFKKGYTSEKQAKKTAEIYNQVINQD